MLAKNSLFFLIVTFSLTSNLYAAEQLKSNEKIKQIVSGRLPMDAEFMGAFLDSTRDVAIFTDGRISSGTLKLDFNSSSGDVYKAQTIITFFEDGAVQSGVLRDETEIAGLKFIAGSEINFFPNGSVASGSIKAGGAPNGVNLIIPTDSQIGFNDSGYAESIRFLIGGNEPFPILNVSVYGNISVVYDKKKKSYLLFQAQNSRAQVVATIRSNYGSDGSPQGIQFIAVPPGAVFYLYTTNPNYSASSGSFDLWHMPKRFILNGIDFGDYANLLVRDMRLHGIQLNQDIIINSRQYKAGQVILIDGSGRIIPPPPA